MLRERYHPVDCGLHARRALMWNVRRHFEGSDKVDYVVLVRVDDPTVYKTLAASVLDDRRRYQAA